MRISTSANFPSTPGNYNFVVTRDGTRGGDEGRMILVNVTYGDQPKVSVNGREIPLTYKGEQRGQLRTALRSVMG